MFHLGLFFKVQVHFILSLQMIDQVDSLKVCLHEKIQTLIMQSHTILYLKSERLTVFHLSLFFNVQVYLALPTQMIDQVGSLKVCLHGQFQTLFLQSHTIL